MNILDEIEISGSDENTTGGFDTYTNNHSSVKKDKVMLDLIPDTISECAIYLNRKPGEPCSRDPIINKIANIMGVKSSDKQSIIESAKKQLGCETEDCVLTKLAPDIGYTDVDNEIAITMKIKGPTDSSLLSNFNCDETLRQWSTGKYTNFFPFNFNMLDYASYSLQNNRVINSPDTLATISFKKLYDGKFIAGKEFRCCGCIINSDTYSGRGKHWMALFADARNPKKWTVEFFNSSGNSPAPEWCNWLVKTANYMDEIIKERKLPAKVEIIKTCDIRHQHSKSECGLYSLFYIWARLNGVDPAYFNNTPIPDQLMFEFRHHLFNDPKRSKIKKFNFDDYKKSVKIEWEST